MDQDHRAQKPAHGARHRLPLAAGFVLLILATASGLAPPRAVAAEIGEVVEGGAINLDPPAGIAFVRPCEGCPQLRLRITERTRIRIGRKRLPLNGDIPIEGLMDVMYDPETKEVIWFSPLQGSIGGR